MQLIKYIWRNVSRNKLRSSLTILSVGFSLALMTVLYGYMAMQAEWSKEATKHNRLVVMNIQGFSGAVPLAYVDRVRSEQGVAAAVPYSWFGGNYKEEQMPFAQFATDPKEVFNVWSEFDIPPDQFDNWLNDRQGCVVDRRLAEKRNWQVGERIPIQGTFFPVTLELNLCGTFDSPQYTDSLWFHMEYLDELLKGAFPEASGNSGTIFLKVDDPDQMATISKAIDARFASSPNPTRTQTEAAFAQMFADMLGNIQLYIRIIGLAVVFALSLVAGNTMAMSMRERTTEIAVLKAIGFSQQRVLWMVLGEACAIAVLGGLLGVLMGCSCLEMMHGFSAQFFPVSVFEMGSGWLIFILFVALCLGFVSGVVPAVKASQISVVDGLRRVA